jgi:hypothetical protein
VAEESNKANSVRLAWPPAKEDLQRLYIEQKLAAAKIATVYGLKYASAKTAESTILYHLKRNGITRRDPAAHVRKVTETMVDEWIVRYQKGESLKQIAGDAVDAVTVFNHLRKRGLSLRDKVEAQIKAVTIHLKVAFSGDYLEKAYLAGLAFGDLGITRHGRAVRARLSTTHPAMSKLFRDLFAGHGPVYEYPRLDQLAGYEWSLDCDLDSSFDFLLAAKLEPMRFVSDEKSFWSFLAGFFDAEGTVYFHKKRNGGAFELAMVNTDVGLLRKIVEELSRRGFALKLERVKVNQEKALRSGVKNPGEFRWRILMWRFEDVCRLMATIPVRHSEKRAKIEIATRMARLTESKQKTAAMTEWRGLLNRIRNERNQYVAEARASYEHGIDPKGYAKSDSDSISSNKLNQWSASTGQ